VKRGLAAEAGSEIDTVADQMVPIDPDNTPRKTTPSKFKVLSRRPTDEPSPERRPKRARAKAVCPEASVPAVGEDFDGGLGF